MLLVSWKLAVGTHCAKSKIGIDKWCMNTSRDWTESWQRETLGRQLFLLMKLVIGRQLVIMEAFVFKPIITSQAIKDLSLGSNGFWSKTRTNSNPGGEISSSVSLLDWRLCWVVLPLLLHHVIGRCIGDSHGLILGTFVSLIGESIW
jgi:tetrahydromethanopterin S-methyltransferase subunit G